MFLGVYTNEYCGREMQDLGGGERTTGFELMDGVKTSAAPEICQEYSGTLRRNSMRECRDGGLNMNFMESYFCQVRLLATCFPLHPCHSELSPVPTMALPSHDQLSLLVGWCFWSSNSSIFLSQLNTAWGTIWFVIWSTNSWFRCHLNSSISPSAPTYLLYPQKTTYLVPLAILVHWTVFCWAVWLFPILPLSCTFLAMLQESIQIPHISEALEVSSLIQYRSLFN